MILSAILILGAGLLGLAILKLRESSESPAPVPIPVERKAPPSD